MSTNQTAEKLKASVTKLDNFEGELGNIDQMKSYSFSLLRHALLRARELIGYALNHYDPDLKEWNFERPRAHELYIITDVLRRAVEDARRDSKHEGLGESESLSQYINLVKEVRGNITNLALLNHQLETAELAAAS